MSYMYLQNAELMNLLVKGKIHHLNSKTYLDPDMNQVDDLVCCHVGSQDSFVDLNNR